MGTTRTEYTQEGYMAKRRYRDKRVVAPDDVKEGDAFAIKVVAVVGAANDWTAYQGPSDWTDDQVAEHGEKLLSEAAKLLFYPCAISDRRYRH